ncbi:MAG: peptidase S9, partial [Muribaculaceae bacterium]|nr:peptidase S9 [Muribaculaceae bacterium]
MASMLALMGVAACNNASDDAPLIEKPQVTVENGQFTPELLNSLGRVSDPKVSPDGKKILYAVSYESIEQN